MKKISLGILLLSLSMPSAFSMEIEETIDSATGDVSALIKNPAHYGSNLPLSGHYTSSDESGVCKMLGYEKAAIGSKRDDYSSKVYSLQINGEGYVTAGPSDYRIKQIVCLNKTNQFPNERSTIVLNPIHAKSNLPLSGYYSSSDENGVCVMLGYEKAAFGSKRNNCSSQVDSIQVNATGNVVGGPSDFPISQIVCLSKR